MKNSKKQTAQKDDMAKKQLEDQLKRALADYHNLERRVEEERRLLSQLSSALLIEKFLPVLDNLENAQKHLNDQGLDIVIKQFKDILSTEGVEEIESEGTHFDPHFHEAVDTEEGPEKGKIVKVIRKGYKIGDKVLRAAQVVVEDPEQSRRVENPVVEEVAEDAAQEVAENV
ncbi:nucleotide exchange factor GrpE [Candidatus Curtissbacteria bacterium RIFCSPHIGHO2_01_FULL_41_11]|uniref:Protein GrpE n=1 Tax=Candidatus Curtissbacteria bacterium RIFCSPHIGHO2_01_FULL_41_11 TaxID=1797711 RepID=A0A1F5G790_9BACT|nr:MAG: nucleotide exchange factor GrpE [Candidatus Curtissbacteria bacterium RIFCSPHIGHO2_01_FULL_41_11]